MPIHKTNTNTNARYNQIYSSKKKDAQATRLWALFQNNSTAPFRASHAAYAACHGYVLLTPDGVDGLASPAAQCFADLLPVARLIASPAWAKVPLLTVTVLLVSHDKL